MQTEPRRASSAFRSGTLSHAIAYDLGRTARQLADGAGAVFDAMRDVSARVERAPRKPPSTAPEPRVEIHFDPRVRARGAYVPATVVLKVRTGQVERVAWTTSVESLDAVTARLRRLLEALQGSVASQAYRGRGAFDPEAVAALAEVSGLSSALEETRLRVLRHDRDETLALLAERLEGLDGEARRQLVEKFGERLMETPPLQQIAKATGFRPIVLEPDDLRALAPVIGAVGRETLRDLGLDDRDIARLGAIALDVGEPLTALAQVYVAPRTFGEHFKRSWRLHRLTFTALQLAHGARPPRR